MTLSVTAHYSSVWMLNNETIKEKINVVDKNVIFKLHELYETICENTCTIKKLVQNCLRVLFSIGKIYIFLYIRKS